MKKNSESKGGSSHGSKINLLPPYYRPKVVAAIRSDIRKTTKLGNLFST
jgi:hypothetical protein